MRLFNKLNSPRTKSLGSWFLVTRGAQITAANASGPVEIAKLALRSSGLQSATKSVTKKRSERHPFKSAFADGLIWMISNFSLIILRICQKAALQVTYSKTVTFAATREQGGPLPLTWQFYPPTCFSTPVNQAESPAQGCGFSR